MESIVAKLNSDDIPHVVAGLEELKRSVEVHAQYLAASPFANELVQIWFLASKQQQQQEDEFRVEELVLNCISALLSSAASASRLAQHLLKLEQFPLTRLRNLVERKHKSQQDLSAAGFRVVSKIAQVDATLAREVQQKFQFKTLLTQTGLALKQIISLATLFAIFLDQHEGNKRVVWESALGAFTLEHLQELPQSLIKDGLMPHLLLLPQVIPPVLKCMQFHPDAQAREDILSQVSILVKAAASGSSSNSAAAAVAGAAAATATAGTGGSKAIALVIDSLEPFGDFAHADVFALCLAASNKRHASNTMQRKMKLCKFEPRNSFHWFKMVSLLCRFLGTGNGEHGVEIPEDLLPRQMLVRGLLYNGNALVRLFTLDLLIHLCASLLAASTPVSKEVLLRRLPEISLLLSFHSTYLKTGLGQDEMLYLRSLRVLELYAKLNLLAKFDTFRFLPEDAQKTNAVVWYHVVRLLTTSLVRCGSGNSTDAESWLKTVDNNKGTVLGKLLEVYSRNTPPLPKETRESLEHLLCLALHGVAKSSSMHVLDCVEVNGSELLVTLSAKRILHFAAQSEDNLKQVQQNLLRLKKERNASFEVEAFAQAFPNQALLDGSLKSSQQAQALWRKTRRCDVAEEIAAPLGQRLARGCQDEACSWLYSRVMEHFASHSTKFSALNAVHVLLQTRPRPKLSMTQVLELNVVLNALREAESAFPLIAQTVSQDAAHYLDSTEFQNDAQHTKATHAQSLCNPLATSQQRVDFAHKLFAKGSKPDFEAFAPLFAFEPELILDAELFRVAFENMELPLLRRALELFPAQACFLANRFPQAVDKFIAACDHHSNDDEAEALRRLFCELPGLFALKAAAASASAAARFPTASRCLAKSQAKACAGIDSVQALEQASVEDLPQLESVSTLVLENFDSLQGALQKLKHFDSKRAVDKAAAKLFCQETLGRERTFQNARLQAVTHLVQLKRLKPDFVLDHLLLAGEQFNLQTMPQAELLNACLERKENGYLEDVERRNTLLHLVLAAYQGTLSKRDMFLRQVLHLIEEEDPLALVGNGFAFGPSSLNKAASSQTLPLGSSDKDVGLALRHCAWLLESLEARRLRAKVDLNRALVPEIPSSSATGFDGYDPSYLLRAFNFVLALHAIEANLPPTAAAGMNEAQEEGEGDAMMDEQPQAALGSSSFHPKRWILGGHLDFILQHLASNVLEVRKESYSCLQRFAQLLARCADTPSNHFRDDVLVLLRALKTGITTEYEQLSPLIATYACEFAQVLCRGVLAPNNALPYRLVTSFLFSNTDAGWRLMDIPLFYETINSGSVADCQAERAFTLTILAKGVASKQDLQILHKRHCLEILISVFDSNMSDAATKRLILKLFHNVALIHTGGGALEVLRNGFLPLAMTVLAKLDADIINSGGGGLELELAVKCSEILKLLAQARLSLFTRIKERDGKRLKLDQRMGENWFPRCEWACDEAEMQFISEELVSSQLLHKLLSTNSSHAPQLDEITGNLLDFLHCQHGLLRLPVRSLVELVRLPLVATTSKFLPKLFDLVLGSTSIHVTTREELERDGGSELFTFALKQARATGQEQATLVWLSFLGRLAPCLLPVPELMECYSHAKLEWIGTLNQVCMIALVGKTASESFTQRARNELVPKLLLLMSSKQGEDDAVQDLLSILLYEALSPSGDGMGYAEVAKFLKI